MSRVLSTLMLLILAGSVCAQEKAINDGPVSFGYASLKGEKVKLKFSAMQMVAVKKKVKKDGKFVERAFMQPQWLIITSEYDLKRVKLYSLDGKEVAAKGVSKLLKKELRVILTTSATLSPFFSQFIKPGTYILVISTE